MPKIKINKNDLERKCILCDNIFYISYPKKPRKICSKSCNISYQNSNITIEESFWNKTSKSDKDKCWIWQGSKNGYGYGQITRKINNSIKTFLAHRISYEIHFGNFDGKLFVCHKCDNPTCVNPNHLFLGTLQDNVNDMVNKNRQFHPKGELHSQSKLKNIDILEIRNSNMSSKNLSEKYNISINHINSIRRKEKWNHLGDLIL